MAIVTGKHADKRTPEDRRNDSINGRNNTKPTALNTEANKVTTGPATGETDHRVLEEREAQKK